ncbi:branched-chain amino acid ABC transporter permease [Mesorhizobium sp. SB112]|uniref:branched-chain amino acid ABC transporter permease n=1 Tax=Mesorhizobium sp. SB112 TaxID=3151853 RepID=UPI0032652FB9
MLYFFQQVLNGVHSGALYALLAFGYALINGMLHRANIAHGAVFAISGQITILGAVFGWQVLWMTLPAALLFGTATAFIYAAFISYLLARNVLAPLARQSPNTIVAATLGVAIALTELGRIASDTKDFWLPPILSTPIVFASSMDFRATLTLLQIVNCSIAVLTLLLASTALAGSHFGRQWRAVSDDPGMAAMVGIDVPKIFSRAIVFGGLAAALAGILAALHYGNIGFGTGLFFGLKVLFITAIGGFHSPSRAAMGAACFAIVESLWAGYFPIEWRDVAMFLALVAILVLRPRDELGVQTSFLRQKS